mmetsp:Transcript_7722/g.11687  ORF Transcript_7722/g.11687 Transcript_7722/m.11687 type:complete len:234 (-) Transcript_7722:43-744(-)
MMATQTQQGDVIKVVIKTMKGSPLTLTLKPTDSVEDIKDKIEAANGVPVAHQVLLLRGKPFESGTLQSNKIRRRATLFLKQQPGSGGSGGSSSASAAADNKPRSPCVANCGFYGDEATDGYCSSCFRKRSDELQKKEQEEANKSARIEAEKQRALEKLRDENRAKQKHKTRCFHCNKHVGLTIIECRCGFTFCGKHRYPADHDCTYDYKEHDTKILSQANQVVKADKMGDRLH